MTYTSQPSPQRDDIPQQADVAIIGGGIAGISLALDLPPTLAVVLLTKNILGESNTRYAQGGLAAAVGQHDSPASQMADTLQAGAGHCDERAVQALVDGAGAAVAQLLAVGTRFDPAPADADDDNKAVIDGAALALGHEAAHSHHRVLHAMGDATGAEIERALVEAVRTRPNITILEQTPVVALDVTDNTCTGVTILHPTDAGMTRHISARAVVLANGGAGRLWRRTSNPAGATADGLALAWRAGATLTDLEFTQFHPTVLAPPDPSMPTFLISEAVRGEGAYLRNHAGERFMLRYPGAELAPRDVVARGILQEMLREGTDHVWLDLRHLDADLVRRRFPTIAATCAGIAIDITRDLIPVAPAAHYFMGGVAVDLAARTTVQGLWAVGEVACTGVHGANRLASNSLLEGVVFGRRAAGDIAACIAAPATTAAWSHAPTFRGEPIMPPPITSTYRADPAIRPLLQTIMWERASLYRDDAELAVAARQLAALGATTVPAAEHATVTAQVEAANMLLIAQLIVAAAQARRESRGSHARHDYPDTDPARGGYRFFVRQQRDADMGQGEFSAQMAFPLPDTSAAPSTLAREEQRR